MANHQASGRFSIVWVTGIDFVEFTKVIKQCGIKENAIKLGLQKHNRDVQPGASGGRNYDLANPAHWAIDGR